MTSLASVMEHITFGLALCKSKKIARNICARNARIPALGYGAFRLSTFSFTFSFSYITLNFAIEGHDIVDIFIVKQRR